METAINGLRHLTIRIPARLHAELHKEMEALEFPTISSLVRYILTKRKCITGIYSTEERDRIAKFKCAGKIAATDIRLSVKVPQLLYDKLLSEQHIYEEKSMSSYVRLILNKRFLKSSILR